MSGGSSGGTTVQKLEPPDYAVPYLKYALQQGQSLAKQPYQQYTGQKLAKFDPLQVSGMQMAANRANQGDEGLKDANRLTQNTLEGKYLNQGAFANSMANNSSAFKNSLAGVDNKYLQNVIDSSSADTMRNFQTSVAPSTDAAFARAGAFGGSAWGQAQAENSRQLAGELARTANDVRYKDFNAQRDLAENYANRQADDVQFRQNLAENFATRRSQAFQNERGRQSDSVNDALGLANQRYTDAEALMKVGGVKQDQQQRGLALSYEQWNDRNQDPAQKLEMFSNLLSSLMGKAGNTQLTKNSRSPWADGLGAILGTAGAASNIYSNFK